MKLSVTTIPKFDKEAKALGKKYPSLKDDLKDLVQRLLDNPEAGTLLFDDVYKIRMAITKKNGTPSLASRSLVGTRPY